MKTSELLIEAKALIVNPENWTQGEYARNKAGDAVDILDGECFCSAGALRRISLERPNEADWGLVVAAWDRLNLLSPIGYVVGYNDSATHEEVMRVWDNAIEVATKLETALG